MTDKIRAALVDYRALAVTRLAIRDADEALREYDARATPALPHGEPVGLKITGLDGATENVSITLDGAKLYAHPARPQALPQGVEEWIADNWWCPIHNDEECDCGTGFVPADALESYLSGMAIVPVERLKYLNDHHHATESGVGLARLALSRGDTQRAIEALNSTSEKLDSILDVLAATKEKGE